MDNAALKTLVRALDFHPRVKIVGGVTPVRRLENLVPGAELWLKDDSGTHPVYGGNKPRKLEYLIAKAQAREQEVLTFGFENSNHAVASVYHCSEYGVPCHLVLVRGPAGMSAAEEARKEKKLALMRSLAASIDTVETYPSAARVGTRRWLLGMGRIRLIPPGGSNALGTLGYVRAAAELADQVARGELPEPAEVYLPLGTGGTAVGLAVGFAAAGMRTRVVAVKVVPGTVNELPRLRWLARQVGRLLPGVDRRALLLENLTVDPSALGEGYGVPTAEGLLAVEALANSEGLALEATYSGKAAASLLRAVQINPKARPRLFWLTYSDYRGPASGQA